MKLRTKAAILGLALLFVAFTTQTALGQAAARAKPTPRPARMQTVATESVVDASLPDDSAVDKMLEVYAPKVRALDVVIGKLNGDLTRGGMGAGSLGNFVSDAMRAEASRKLGKPIFLTVTNAGGLRKSVIPEGELRLRDIFELMPFENALMSFDLTGAQILKLLEVVVAYRDAQSGARIKYRVNGNKKPELETARLLVDGVERDIDPAATYTVISIDYLYSRRSTAPSETEGNYAVLGEAQNAKPLGLTLRDAITNYVKAESAAGREITATRDGRFVPDKGALPAAEASKP
jgi:2',3'-cyclic-nucleotide 2'-phosphodiesterase (5'-nucleotidase family)